VCKEDNNIFITCARCGMRTDIDINSFEYLKIDGDNV
jgi:transcription elongation factor Elf1